MRIQCTMWSVGGASDSGWHAHACVGMIRQLASTWPRKRGHGTRLATRRTQRTIWSAGVLAFAQAAVAQPAITIDGGADVSAHNYKWTVSHDHSAPLVYVEMPHFRVDTFTVPEGWTAEIENQNSLDLKPGRCIANAEDPNAGLPRGEPGVFTLRVNPAKALRGQAEAIFRFADGVEVTKLLELPVKPSSFEQWAPPVALGAMFAVFVAVQAARKKKRRRARLANGPGAS